LQELGLSYMDLYLIHWPTAFAKTPAGMFPKNDKGEFINAEVPIEDTWRAMEGLVRKGLCKAIGSVTDSCAHMACCKCVTKRVIYAGVSNFTTEQVDRILSIASIKPVRQLMPSRRPTTAAATFIPAVLSLRASLVFVVHVRPSGCESSRSTRVSGSVWPTEGHG